MLPLLRLPLRPPPPSPPHHRPYLHPLFPKPLLRFPLHPLSPPTPTLSSARRCTSPLSPADDFTSDAESELSRLLVLLPDEMRRKLNAHPDRLHLVEVVMDLGRRPLARFPSGDFLLSDRSITSRDLEHATSLVGDFAADNRAGISRTLHRISAIRNRKGVIVGLTCRVGRAVPGSAGLLRDLVMCGESLLIIGPPGVGKTTVIRDIARMLADDYKKRVMIVDTSNEIGGDGDIPHSGIGSARRLQVPNTDMQHKVLIEAVENHMPQVIVIDEIGTKLEAMAASTIAQRGIQLVASAHGVTIENLIMNPSLEMLVGGIQSVTLGDEEASRRRVQKTVLERKGPSTFTCGAEIISKTELHVHHSLEATVDALLAGGRSPNFEVRKINENGSTQEMFSVRSEPVSVNGLMGDEIRFEDYTKMNNEEITDTPFSSEVAGNLIESSKARGNIYLYAYGISETTVSQAIKHLGMDEMISLTDNISEAHVFLALHSKLKKNSQIQAVVKYHDIPIYVTKTSSLVQIEKAIFALKRKHDSGFNDTEETKAWSSEETDALEEARLGIEQVVIPKGEPVQLLPRPPHMISAQIGLIERYKLKWERIVQDSDVCLRILPFEADNTMDTEQLYDASSEHEELSVYDNINGSHNGINMLPFLPE